MNGKAYEKGVRKSFVYKRHYFVPVRLSINQTIIAHRYFKNGLRTDQIADRLKTSEACIANSLAHFREITRLGLLKGVL